MIIYWFEVVVIILNYILSFGLYLVKFISWGKFLRKLIILIWFFKEVGRVVCDYIGEKVMLLKLCLLRVFVFF